MWDSYVAVDGGSPVGLARVSSRLRSTLGLLGFGAGLGAANILLLSRVGSGWIEVKMPPGIRGWLEMPQMAVGASATGQQSG